MKIELSEAARIIALLTVDERDELLQALVISLHNDPANAASNLDSYLREYAFSQLIQQIAATREGGQQ